MSPNIPPPFRRPAPAPVATTAPAPAAPAPSGPPDQSVKNKPVVTAEGVMKRLNYFENLAFAYENYISQLQATIKRQGAAPPSAFFAPLTGEGGSYTPKVTS